MIFDRTQTDIDNAVAIRDDYVKKFIALSDEQIEILERGFLTVNTLNRIENKKAELRKIFAELGYMCESFQTAEWTRFDYFREKDFERILKNIDTLRTALFTYSSTPEIPGTNFRTYQVINDVERILNDLELMTSDIKANYRVCGAFSCGED